MSKSKDEVIETMLISALAIFVEAAARYAYGSTTRMQASRVYEEFQIAKLDYEIGFKEPEDD